ncbi:MAG: glycosyltransferase family 87 protein [Anaerolineales bacterium]
MGRLKFKFSLAELIVFFLISGQIALYGLMWFRLIYDESLKTMDFISFYSAGRIFRTGNFEDVYDPNSEAVLQRKVVGGSYDSPLVFNHPPYVLPILGLIATDHYVSSYMLWSGILLLVILFCGDLTRRYLLKLGWSVQSAILTTFGCLTFFPLFISLLIGQDSAFTLIGLLIWTFAILNQEEIQAGLGLAFATLSPVIAGALAFPLFASRRRAGIWFIVGSFAMAIYSLLLVRIKGMIGLIDLLLLSSKGQAYGFNWSSMYNVLAFLIRNFPNMGIGEARTIAWALTAVSIIILSVFWWNKRNLLRIEHIGIAVALSTLTAPHLNLHGLSFLVIPIIGLAIVLRERGYTSLSVLLAPIFSTFAILIVFLTPNLGYSFFYFLILFLILSLWFNLKLERL